MQKLTLFMYVLVFALSSCTDTEKYTDPRTGETRIYELPDSPTDEQKRQAYEELERLIKDNQAAAMEGRRSNNRQMIDTAMNNAGILADKKKELGYTPPSGH